MTEEITRLARVVLAASLFEREAETCRGFTALTLQSQAMTEEITRLAGVLLSPSLLVVTDAAD